MAEAAEATAMLREVEGYRLRVAYAWAVSHPTVDAFTAEALSVATACAPASASALMADALDLVHRLPILWNQVQAGMAPVWKARRVAAKTRHLSADAAAWVDRHLAGLVSSLGSARLDRMVAEAAARDGDALADRERRAREDWDVVLSHPGEIAGTTRLIVTGDTVDLTRFHEVVCAEAETMAALGDTDDLGARKARALGVIADQQARLGLTHCWIQSTPTYGKPLTLDLLHEWVGRARVTIQPVLHVATEDRWSVDRHDPPPRMADQVRLRDDVCVFPWCSCPTRACDLDHVEPYASPDDDGPPGQTAPAHFAPRVDDIIGPRHLADGDTTAMTPANTSGTDPPEPPRSSPTTAPSRSHSADTRA